jgi:putative transposase
MNQHREYYHRHLPHWQPTGAVFFITFRLKGSLPYEVIDELQDERKREKIEAGNLPLDQRGKQNYLDEDKYFGKLDNLLDKAQFGPRWLSQPEIAEIVKEALIYRDGKVFDLYALCIMSNHVHVVFKPLERKSDYQSDLQTQSDVLPLHKIMQSLKRHTGREANIVLGRQGAFWQDESYDHVIRDNDELLRIINYVLENPVKAGLTSKREDWQWSYCKDGIL